MATVFLKVARYSLKGIEREGEIGRGELKVRRMAHIEGGTD